MSTTIYIGRHFEVRDHDQPTKYVFNGETRVAAITGSLSTNSRIQRVRLRPGWNLLSLAVTASDALGQFNAAGFGQGETVSAAYWWDPATRGYAPLTTGQTVAAGAVLWIKAETNAVVGITGAYSEPIGRHAEAGGTYLAATGVEAWSPNFAPTISAWTYNAASKQWHHELAGDLTILSDPPPTLAPGEALFVRADTAVDLEIPNPTLRFRYYHPDHLGSSSVITDAQGMVLEETAFHPFGCPRHEYQPRQSRDPYQFTQKERDVESGLYYFGARFGAPGLSKFLAPDPKYLNPDRLSTNELASLLPDPSKLNVYAYAKANPVRWIDPSGLAPGDPYRTADQAATDALLAANPESIVANREFGGLVYYDPNVERYYATKPVPGGLSGFSPSSVTIPGGAKLVGDFHTHGDYTFIVRAQTLDSAGNVGILQIPLRTDPALDSFDSEHFSQTDLRGISADSAGRAGYKGYLGTPSGALHAFDPATGIVSPMPRLTYPSTSADVPTFFKNAIQPLLDQARRTH